MGGPTGPNGAVFPAAGPMRVGSGAQCRQCRRNEPRPRRLAAPLATVSRPPRAYRDPSVTDDPCAALSPRGCADSFRAVTARALGAVDKSAPPSGVASPPRCDRPAAKNAPVHPDRGRHGATGFRPPPSVCVCSARCVGALRDQPQTCLDIALVADITRFSWIAHACDQRPL